jgi:hypothetical protein
VRCWWCGVEPEEVYEITTLAEAEPRYLPHWPGGGDHEHAERRPTPAQMEQAGHETLARIQRLTWPSTR